MKPPWFYDIIARKFFLNLFPITLVRILYVDLHKEMCLKWKKITDIDSLGIKAKKEEFVLPHSLSNFLDELSILIVITQKFSKHHCVNSAFGHDFKEV